MATQPVDLKGMTIEQIRAHRAKLDEEIRKREEELRADAERQILALASSHDIDLAKLARSVRIYRNPDDPWDTWNGKGRKPKWVQKWLAAGRSLEELEAKDDDKKRGSGPGPATG
jgi:DNA-binding protein H-NS